MKIKILVAFVITLLLFTAIPVAGILNQDNYIDNQFEGKDIFLTSTSDEDWWSMFRHDSANTGCSSCDAPDTNELCWQQSVSESIEFAAPIVVEEKLYLSTGGYYNINPPEQLTLQRKSINEKPTPISLLQDINSVIEDQDYGSLYCFNSVSGTPLWDLYVGWSQNPAVVDGKIYFTTLDFYSASSTVQCRDAETGQTTIWERPINGWILSSVIVANDKVYIGALDFFGSYTGKLYCLNAQNGNTLWTHTMSFLEFLYYTAPAVADGMVYYVTFSLYGYDGYLYCLDAGTGQQKWSRSIGYSELCSPVVSDGKVYINCFSLYSDYGVLRCFDAITGSPIWSYDFGYDQFSISNPAVYLDSLYIAVVDYSSYSGKILCINKGTGDLIYDYEIYGIPFYSSPAIADDKIYIPVVDIFSYSGKIVCLNINDGSLIWDYMIDSESMSSPAIACGRVYVPDTMGNIYAVGYPNDPPTPPTITGEKNGKVGKPYDYTFVSTDPEDENIYYFIYWGDDSSSGWIGPYKSGEVATVSHTWAKKDKYNNFFARAKDIHGSKSDWSTYEVTMPASYHSFRSIIQNLLENLVQHFPILEKICILYLQLYKYLFNQEVQQ